MEETPRQLIYALERTFNNELDDVFVLAAGLHELLLGKGPIHIFVNEVIHDDCHVQELVPNNLLHGALAKAKVPQVPQSKASLLFARVT